MKNPFRSEGDAFRFLWLVIGYCVLIPLSLLYGGRSQGSSSGE